MKMLFQLLCSFLLLAWPVVAFISVMLFDAPGSLNDSKKILTALLILFYPALIGLAYFLFNQNFWWFSPRTFLLICIGAPIFASFVFDYPRLLTNSLKGIPSHGYFVKDGAVYYSGRKIKADAESFKTIGERFIDYGKDKISVFYRDFPIPDADPETFAAVHDAGINLYKDKKRVYYNGLVVPDADPVTIRPLIYADTEFRMFFADQHFVYYSGQKLVDLDGKTAELITPNHVKDTSSVYFLNRKIEGAHAASFKVLEQQFNFAVDKNYVYCEDQLIPNAKPASFQVLIRGYARDSESVFFKFEPRKVEKIEGAEAATFEATEYDSATGSDARDGNHFYLQGSKKK